VKQESELIGRDEQLTALYAAFEAADDAGHLVAVQGPAGVGKSALLRAAADTWRADSVTVITVRFAGNGDPYGFDTLLQSLREHFGQIDEPLLSRPLSVLGRLVAAYEPTSAGHAPRIALEIRRLFDLIARRRRTVLVVDDVDAVPAPALALQAASRPGTLVIAAIADGAVPSPGAAQLRKLADLVIDVPALSDEDAHSMIAKRYQASVDGMFLAALRSALGPLMGHPGTLTATIEELEKHQRVRNFVGHACIADPAAAIPLPREHAFVRTVCELGATDLVVGLGVGGLGIDELPALAEAAGGEVGRYGGLVDCLVEKGLLLADAQGVLRCSSPALANRLCAEAGPAAVARLRRSLAEVLLRRLDRGEEVNLASLLAVVADAGSSIAPNPRVAMLLESAAIQAGADFERVAKWLRAALWHAADYPPQRARIITRLLGAVLRLGHYDFLREVVDEVAGRIGGWAMLTEAQLDDLAAAAMLAALHTGIPVPASTADALSTGRTAMPAPLEFAARWFAGADFGGDYLRESDVPRDAMAVLAEGQLRQIAHALAARPDAALSVFEAVLGSRYTPPATGLLAAYRRVRHGYASGDFVAALAAARELELTAAVDTPVHAFSRLLAAEMCRLRGEHTISAEWMAKVQVDGCAQALRFWVSTGFAVDDKSGPEAAAALDAGCAGYHAGHHCQPGLELLLLRLIRLAVIAGRPGRARFLLTELEALAGNDPQSRATSMLLSARAIVRHDVTAAHAAVQVARRRQELPALQIALLAAGRIVADPKPLLYEAYALAAKFGSAAIRTQIAEIMRDRGISPPHSRSARVSVFSTTELDIIKLVSSGLTNRQIAVRLRLSVKSVENYLTRLFARTGCRSRLELAAASMEGSLATPRPPDPQRAPGE
jgi:DNA-binding NarL/FixJ family response regulator